MLRIAVTGATGFVGKFVADYLESKGYKVFRFGRKQGEDILCWDISKSLYDKPIENIDCVVHCAARVDDWSTYKESYQDNVLGTGNVIKSFPEASKFIYISSASVYDAFCKEVVISENKCIGGKLLNSYSLTKLLGEKKVEESNIPSRVILRPHIIYGPGDTTIGPRIRNSIKLGYFFAPGDGKNRISFTHVENLSQAVWQSIKLSKEGYSVYNITDKEPVIFRDALKSVRSLNDLNFKEIFISKKLCLAIGSILEFWYRLLGSKKPPLLTRYIVDQISSDHILDISKAKKELQYDPIKNIYSDFLL